MPVACSAAPFRATMTIPALRARSSIRASRASMRCWRRSVCRRCSARKGCQPAGPRQRSMPARSAETPWIAATAGASRHSSSLHCGGSQRGCASAAASDSVTRCKALCRTRSGGSGPPSMAMLDLLRSRAELAQRRSAMLRRERHRMAEPAFGFDEAMPTRAQCPTSGRGGWIDLIMQEVPDGPIKLRGVGTGEHHHEVAAFLPVSLILEPCLDEVVERSAGKRIRDADSDIVRPRKLDESPRGQHVLELFAGITELDEESDADAGAAQSLARRMDLRHGRALVHGVEHPLAAALGAEPRLAAARLAQRSGHAFG